MPGTLLLNALYIESVGAELAVKGDTLVAGGNLHVTMGQEPKLSTRTRIADFTGASNYAQLLMSKAWSLDGVRNGKLDYKGGYLDVVRPGGTIIILR